MGATLVLALGITLSGEKRILGFVGTDTENEKALTSFLRSLLERGLDLSQGMLVIIDGGKGLRAAVKGAFQQQALMQCCQWDKRENVVAYLGQEKHRRSKESGVIGSSWLTTGQRIRRPKPRYDGPMRNWRCETNRPPAV